MRYQHFIERCRERGITSVDCAALAREIEVAVRNNAHEYVEKVFSHEGSSVWRFRLPVEGIFYAVVRDQTHPVCTVLTQEMLRTYKDIRRGRAKSVAEAKAFRQARNTEQHARSRRRRMVRQWD